MQGNVANKITVLRKRSFEQREKFLHGWKGLDEPFQRKVNQQYRDKSIQSKDEQLERQSSSSRPQK
jgi:hypothetical protein